MVHYCTALAPTASYRFKKNKGGWSTAIIGIIALDQPRCAQHAQNLNVHVLIQLAVGIAVGIRRRAFPDFPVPHS